MARLPYPGGDDGQWGSILNEFLDQIHNSDGSLKDEIISKAKLSSSVQASLNNADAAVSGSVPDATNSTKGKILLTGDLGGTADSPTIANGTITSAKIADNTITDTDISPSAAIAQSKVANLTTDLAAKADATAALLKVDNLSGLTSQLTARTNLGLGTAATVNVPASGDASTSQAVKGDDTRLSDSRTPADASVTPAKLTGSPSVATGNGVTWNGSAWVGTDLVTQAEFDAHVDAEIGDYPRELGYLVKQDGSFSSTTVYTTAPTTYIPTTGADVPGTTLTVTKGSRPIMIRVKVGRLDNLSTGSGGISVLSLFEDGVDVDTAVMDIRVGGRGTGVTLEHRSTLAAGIHTYKLRLATASGGTAVLAADLLLPVKMSVTEVGT